jgi:hypothetical protein
LSVKKEGVPEAEGEVQCRKYAIFLKSPLDGSEIRITFSSVIGSTQMNSIVYFIGFGWKKSLREHPANLAENGLPEKGLKEEKHG